LTFFLFVVPLVSATCYTVAVPSGHVCEDVLQSPYNTTTTQDWDAVSEFVLTELIKFTSGECTDDACSLTDVQGPATTGCFNAAVQLLCLKAVGPDPTDSDTACATAAANVPSISTCESALGSCSATINSTSLETRSYCDSYACDPSSVTTSAGECGFNGTCTTPFSDAAPSCECADGYFGTRCGYEKVECPESDNGFDCSGHGICNFFDGTCQCILQFDGLSCEAVSCIHEDDTSEGECNGHGICHAVGVCQCDAGWIGATCTMEIEDSGMTKGEYAGAVAGGIFVSLFMVGGAVYLCTNNN